jgi:hypothetical protein
MDIVGGFIWLGLILLVGGYLAIFGRVDKRRKD